MYTTFTPQTRALNILANQMIFFSLFFFPSQSAAHV